MLHGNAHSQMVSEAHTFAQVITDQLIPPSPTLRVGTVSICVYVDLAQAPDQTYLTLTFEVTI